MQSGYAKDLDADLEKRFENFEKILSAKYEAKVDNLATDRKSFEDLIRAATWVGGIASVLLVVFSFFIGKSITDIQSVAKTSANNAFQDAIRERTAEGVKIEGMVEKSFKILDSLKNMEKSLEGYVRLLGVAESASSFDPLIGYYSIDREIDERSLKTRYLFSGDSQIKMEETTRDQQFRQKAAVIFEKLLASVREDKKTGNIRFEVETLYNAAADASKIDMDFVSLELMEMAFAIDKKASPVIEARLIRQRLSMSRISPEEALSKIQTVLSKTKGHDVHHVVSEAFNIGIIISDPSGMAELIRNNLPNDLFNVSYVKLNQARLFLMGNSEEHWSRGKKIACKGVLLMEKEVSSAPWYENSEEEIMKINRSNPGLLSSC